MAFEHTKMGRTYAAHREWLASEQVRGGWNEFGMPWESHPSWSSAADRDRWHRNWGELLNFHTTAHVRTVMTNGVTERRLRIRVTHPDSARLELVRSVTGGSIEAGSGPRTVARLEIERLAAFNALKAGRAFIDPANAALIEVITAAMRFYRSVPERGQAATNEQQVDQEYWQDKLDQLSGAYVSLARPPHDCAEAINRSGQRDWGAEPPKRSSDDLYF